MTDTTTPPTEAGGKAPELPTPPQTTDGPPAAPDTTPTIASTVETTLHAAEGVVDAEFVEVVAALRDGMNALNQIVVHGSALLNFGDVHQQAQTALAKLDAWLAPRRAA